MKLYNNLIKSLQELLCDSEKLEGAALLKQGDKNPILLKSDTAFELGGSQKSCVSSLAVSSDLKFTNGVYLLGNDLNEIKCDSPFAKVVFVEVEDFENEQQTFDKIKELEALRYKLSIDGFMTRASAFSQREQIRVSKSAIKNGVTFSQYGNTILNEYLSFDFVKSADIYFITDFHDFEKLNSISQKISQTTSALNHIFDNIMFDCSTCNLKEICDEVEGLKELHFKNAKK